MRLLKYEGYNVTVEPEMLLIKPFKKIWDRDTSDNKAKALLEFGVIYFMCDPRSDYQYIVDEDIRLEEIKKAEGLNAKWKPDKDLLDAMEYYKSVRPMAALLLEDTRAAIDKLRKFIKEINLYATDDKGKPLYSMDSYTRTIRQITELVKELNNAEKELNKDITQRDKVRGALEKSIYEDM